jgi:peroxiredoxin
MKAGKLYLLMVLLLLGHLFLVAQNQTYFLEAEIKNQPVDFIVVGKVHGDRFLMADTIPANVSRAKTPSSRNGSFSYRFPSDATPGIYRLILGQTTYARVMNQPPQQLDLIFNNENIKIKTDFNAPDDSLEVLGSEENRIWHGFRKNDKRIQLQMKEMIMELDHLHTLNGRDNPASGGSSASSRLTDLSKRYNQLQKERASMIKETVASRPALFASRMIARQDEPFLDGSLSPVMRQQIFRNSYLEQIDFTDESLMNSPVYTEKVFRYLMSYGQRGLTRDQQEKEFIKATDLILSYVRYGHKNKMISEGIVAKTPDREDNLPVYEFILDYLVRGFEQLNLENVLIHIADHYAGTTCQTDEKTTLERRMAAQKMRTGTQVPDFTLSDVSGKIVTLSKIAKERNLLVFWASWCPHCLEMLPEIKKVISRPGAGEMQVIAISLDTLRSEWTDKVKAMGIDSWINLSDLKGWDGQATTDYNVYATPTMLVVDRELRILAKPGGVADLIP